MTAIKTFQVRFSVVDHYSTEIKARSEAEAVAKATALYKAEHEDAFELDISEGGPCNWDAEEVQS